MSAENLARLRASLEAYPVLTRVVPTDLLVLDEPLLSVLQQAYRQGQISLFDLARGLDLEAWEAREFAAFLLEKGYLQPAPQEPGGLYHARFSGRITRPGGSPLDKI